MRDNHEDIFTSQAEEHRDTERIERDEDSKAHDGGDDKRCKLCGDALMLYNDELIIDGLCPYCGAKQVKDIIRQKKEGIIMDKEIVVRDAIVMPAVTAEKAVEAFNAYQELAQKIIRPEDVQKIAGKDFKKKSFWRKCQRFFNLSLEKIEERREEHNGIFSYHFTYRATAPNGAYGDGCGSCSFDEKGLLKTEHNTRAIAETRAKNRAIADLVAFGEVSAEEVTDNGTPEKKPIGKRLISDAQRKRLYAISKSHNVPEETMKDYLKEIHNLDSSKDITTDIYDDICEYANQYEA